MATPIKDNTTALEELLDRARALPSVPGSVEQATPTIAVSSGGLITASATQGAGVVAAGTKSATRQLPTKGATTIEPSDEVQTAVPAGTYVTGDIKVAAKSGGGGNATWGELIIDGNKTTITIEPGFEVSHFLMCGVSLSSNAVAGADTVFAAPEVSADLGATELAFMVFNPNVTTSVGKISGVGLVSQNGGLMTLDLLDSVVGYFDPGTYIWVAAS